MGSKPDSGIADGKFNEEIEREFLVWRLVFAGKITLAEVKADGCVTLCDLLKLHALMDCQEATQERLNKQG